MNCGAAMIGDGAAGAERWIGADAARFVAGSWLLHRPHSVCRSSVKGWGLPLQLRKISSERSQDAGNLSFGFVRDITAVNCLAQTLHTQPTHNQISTLRHISACRNAEMHLYVKQWLATQETGFVYLDFSKLLSSDRCPSCSCCCWICSDRTGELLPLLLGEGLHLLHYLEFSCQLLLFLQRQSSSALDQRCFLACRHTPCSALCSWT